MKKNTVCRLCGSTDLKNAFGFGASPPGNALYQNKDESKKKKIIHLMYVYVLIVVIYNCPIVLTLKNCFKINIRMFQEHLQYLGNI